MGRPLDFHFEPAPELPGADRLSKYAMAAIRRLAFGLWDVEIEGREHVPLEGPAIIAPNHLSFCDSIFVPSALPRRVWAIGKGEYLDDWKTKHLFPALGMIPVDRSGGDAAKAALDTASKVLDGGHLFMIYPEGTRSRSQFLHKGRTGAARLAIGSNAPIVPVGHSGTLAVQPPDSFTMKIHQPVSVRFGAPMWAHDFGDPDDPRTLRRFTDAVMYEISQLSGQRYVDVYAAGDDTPGVVATRGSATDRPSVNVSTKPDAASVDDEERVTPRRPSVVGGTGRPEDDAERPSRPLLRPPSGRPSVPRGSDAPGPIPVPKGRTPTPVGGD